MGEKRNLYGLQKFFEHEDRQVRASAYKEYSAFYHGHEERLEEIWEELITIRTQMAKNLGYENFIPVGYMPCRCVRNCMRCSGNVWESIP